MRYASRSLMLLALVLTACSVHTRPSLPKDEVKKLAAMAYPADAPRGEDLDIIAHRDGDTLRLINRTPRSYANVTLWLNQQYVRPIDRLDIGPDNAIDLRTSVDRHHRCYPVGSFLKPEQRLQLVQAELFDPATNQRHRLTVQPEKDPARR